MLLASSWYHSQSFTFASNQYFLFNKCHVAIKHLICAVLYFAVLTLVMFRTHYFTFREKAVSQRHTCRLAEKSLYLTVDFIRLQRKFLSNKHRTCIEVLCDELEHRFQCDNVASRCAVTDFSVRNVS